MHQPTQLLLILAGFSGVAAQHANAQLPRAPRTSPTVIAGPASLTAVSYATAEVTLIWPAVAGAVRYKVTRGAYDYETTVAEFATTAFVFEGASCVAGSGTPNCVFIHSNSRLLASPGSFEVMRGALYNYRVWAIFPGPVLSPPSPWATVRVR
ncbi:MAG: hypothetical protein ACKVZ0_09640 [Gemmatimonadales bacterium]